jgi:hypothetical protein
MLSTVGMRLFGAVLWYRVGKTKPAAAMNDVGMCQYRNQLTQ